MQARRKMERGKKGKIPFSWVPLAVPELWRRAGEVIYARRPVAMDEFGSQRA